MHPNYSGRLLDKLVVTAAQQTSGIRQNPDDPGYVEARAEAMRTLVLAWWDVRNELQVKRDPNFKP